MLPPGLLAYAPGDSLRITLNITHIEGRLGYCHRGGILLLLEDVGASVTGIGMTEVLLLLLDDLVCANSVEWPDRES